MTVETEHPRWVTSTRRIARRTAGRLARRMGLKISALTPADVIVSRSTSYQSSPLVAGDSYLVRRRGGGRVRIAKMGERGWLVAKRDESPQAAVLLENETLKHLGAQHVAWLLRRYEVDCVLDVGANNGQFAAGLRRDGYRGHIVSFEPVPAFADALEKLAAGDDKWSVRRIALGSSEGTVPIHVQRTFSSLLASSDYGKKRFATLRDFADTEPIDVPLRRLDAILDELLEPVVAGGVEHPRVFLKMDTQGFDLEVFRGLGERTADVVGLQSEVALLLIYDAMPRMPDAIATYEAAGFELTGLYPVTREPDGRVIEYDCTMVRAETLPG
jgi:FkbM family methyltransferase